MATHSPPTRTGTRVAPLSATSWESLTWPYCTPRACSRRTRSSNSAISRGVAGSVRTIPAPRDCCRRWIRLTKRSRPPAIPDSLAPSAHRNPANPFASKAAVPPAQFLIMFSPKRSRAFVLTAATYRRFSLPSRQLPCSTRCDTRIRPGSVLHLRPKSQFAASSAKSPANRATCHLPNRYPSSDPTPPGSRGRFGSFVPPGTRQNPLWLS